MIVSALNRKETKSESQVNSILNISEFSQKPAVLESVLRDAQRGYASVNVDSDTSALVTSTVDNKKIRVNIQEAFLILNVMSTPGGVEEEIEQEKESVVDEIKRSLHCGRSQATFESEQTFQIYMKRLNCGKWWCPKCGDLYGANGNVVPGEIHKHRRKSVYARMNAGFEVVTKEQQLYFTETIKKLIQIQYVFTVPRSERHLFKSKDGLNALCSSAKRIILKNYPDCGAVAYIHVVGDNSPEFHPHINVHVYVPGDTKIMPKKIDGTYQDKSLDRIKQKWALALKAHGATIQRSADKDTNNICKYVVDVHKTFVPGHEPFRIMHRIRYMTKPIPYQVMCQLIETNNMEDLRLYTLGLKGFRFIRYWGKLNNNKYKTWLQDIRGLGADSEVEEMAKSLRTEEEHLAGERLRSLGICKTSIEELMKRPDVIVEKVGPDFYKIKANPLYHPMGIRIVDGDIT